MGLVFQSYKVWHSEKVSLELLLCVSIWKFDTSRSWRFLIVRKVTQCRPRLSFTVKSCIVGGQQLQVLSFRADFYCRVIFPCERTYVNELKAVYEGPRLNALTSLNFYVYQWPSIHCLYFIYARKIYVRTHVYPQVSDAAQRHRSTWYYHMHGRTLSPAILFE